MTARFQRSDRGQRGTMRASEIRFEKPVTPALILAPPEFGTVSTDATKCRPNSFSSRPVICEQAGRPACREMSDQPTTKRCSVVNFEQPVRPPFATMSGAEGSYGNWSCRGAASAAAPMRLHLRDDGRAPCQHHPNRAKHRDCTAKRPKTKPRPKLGEGSPATRLH
jgi:hypothetical protein